MKKEANRTENLSYILDELMTWHNDPEKDFSHPEVNQYAYIMCLFK